MDHYQDIVLTSSHDETLGSRPQVGNPRWEVPHSFVVRLWTVPVRLPTEIAGFIYTPAKGVYPCLRLSIMTSGCRQNQWFAGCRLHPTREVVGFLLNICNNGDIDYASFCVSIAQDFRDRIHPIMLTHPTIRIMTTCVSESVRVDADVVICVSVDLLVVEFILVSPVESRLSSS
jgi:hypothetical protein